MSKIIISIILATLCACVDPEFDTLNVESTNDNLNDGEMFEEFDFINAYQLKIENTFLFGQYDEFINEIGLPSTVKMKNTEYKIESRADLDQIMEIPRSGAIVTLNYPGLDMWYAYDNSIIPYTIDLRKTEKKISYKDVILDENYSAETFIRQFPKSANVKMKMPISLFELNTSESGQNFEQYMLLRRTKDDPNATPMVELTFENGHLIFIFFANFG